MNIDKSQAPSLIKLGACLFYEGLVLIALLFVSAWLYVWLVGDATQGIKRFIMQLFLWAVIGFYFIYSWLKKGQTMPMQSWRFKLVHGDAVVLAEQEQALLPFNIALFRYLLATLSLCCFGLGFLWCLFDREHQFLHDRVLKTRIIAITQ